MPCRHRAESHPRQRRCTANICLTLAFCNRFPSNPFCCLPSHAPRLPITLERSPSQRPAAPARLLVAAARQGRRAALTPRDRAQPAVGPRGGRGAPGLPRTHSRGGGNSGRGGDPTRNLHQVPRQAAAQRHLRGLGGGRGHAAEAEPAAEPAAELSAGGGGGGGGGCGGHIVTSSIIASITSDGVASSGTRRHPFWRRARCGERAGADAGGG